MTFLKPSETLILASSRTTACYTNTSWCWCRVCPTRSTSLGGMGTKVVDEVPPWEMPGRPHHHQQATRETHRIQAPWSHTWSCWQRKVSRCHHQRRPQLAQTCRCGCCKGIQNSGIPATKLRRMHHGSQEHSIHLARETGTGVCLSSLGPYQFGRYHEARESTEAGSSLCPWQLLWEESWMRNPNG